MPLQNRVNPFGGLDAVSARGAWLGNRGILHNDCKKIVAKWRTKAWITCRLQYKGVHRSVFSPHTWSELFFLDEATALAAGHRPCAYCRRQRYNEFKQVWCAANSESLTPAALHATAIDARLHAERVNRHGQKVTYATRFGSLPPGTIVLFDGTAYLVWRDRLFPWSHWGYGSPRAAPANDTCVDVLTPRPIVSMFAHGFRPEVHASACRSGGPAVNKGGAEMDAVLPSKLLAAQHREIDQGLRGISDGTNTPTALMTSLKLLREHLYIEEEVVFRMLGKTGLAMAVLVMRREHGQMWPLIQSVEAACAAGASVDNTREDVRKLLALLAVHNPKEEQTVYAAADRYDLAHPDAPLATAIAAARIPDGWVYPTAAHPGFH